MRRAWTVSVSTGLALLAAGAAGCSATLPVQQYPPFYDPELKTVAVLAFANKTLHPKAGEHLSGRLAEALRDNGTYEVVDPEALKTKLLEADLTPAPGADAEAVAAALRKLGGIDAFLIGEVTGFAAERGSYAEVWEDPWYGPGYGGSGRWGWGWGYRRWHPYWGYGLSGHYPVYRRYSHTNAYVAARAALVRTADGSTIHATPVPLAAHLRSVDEPPRMRDELLMDAAAAVADGLVGTFAIVPKRLKVSKGKTLRTARKRPDGELKFTDDFRAGETELVVVLRLPPAAARNAFRIVLARKKDPQPVAEETVVWSADDEALELAFSLPALVEAAGTGDFEARLYAGETLVLKRGFEIDK